MSMLGTCDTRNMMYDALSSKKSSLVHLSDCIIDSDASHHISSNFRAFENVREAGKDETVIILNGDSLKVNKIGDVILNKCIKLNDVLYAPNLNANLISSRKLSEDMGCAITYFLNVCVIQDPIRQTLIGLGDIKMVYTTCETHIVHTL